MRARDERRTLRFQSTLPTRGSDRVGHMAEYDSFMFQSTLPTRGSDLGFVATYTDDDSVSIHAPHEGERLSASCIRALALNVSIHAPHEGERPWAAGNPDYALDVSIHAPHEGERRRKSAFVCSISANLLNIIHCGTVTRAVSRRRIALFRLFSVRRSGVFMYAYASH